MIWWRNKRWLTCAIRPARSGPWALNASFIAPHFPLVVPERFFNLYPLDQIDMPEIPPGHLESQHPVHQRMRAMFGESIFPKNRCAAPAPVTMG